MTTVVDIVKHHGKRPTESFSRQKLFNSITEACLRARTPEGEAEMIGTSVCQSVIDWLKDRPEVTSRDLVVATTRFLAKQDPEAAYLYEHYHLIM